MLVIYLFFQSLNMLYDIHQSKMETDLEVMKANKLGKLITIIAKELKVESVGVAMRPGVSNAGISQILIGVHDASYKDNRFRKEPEGGFPTEKFKMLTLLGCSSNVVNDIALTTSLTNMIASGVKFAKDLVGAPSNSKTPLVIADLSRQIGSDHNIEVKVLGQEECEVMYKYMFRKLS
jgi:leucyl aminopeptidase